MSDLQVHPVVDSKMGRCFDDRPSSLLDPEPSNPPPSSIPAENWREVERAGRGVIGRIQPTKRSERRRGDVVEYVQRLIKTRLGCEVFPFGSVPLKTYLPDGDIDLTAFGPPNSEENLAINVRAILEGEEQNNAAEFEVRDVQYIHAEVKLVKCLVQNIVVDISFNQIGGLCTLCFLEKVDDLIGKGHLLKQSIILIKAWCYYESRILGANHSLLSTYALETLVLYIFHLFNSSLDSPVAVLYRFLDYFGKFDWDNFCVSLHGSVPISSLPQTPDKMPEVDECELLFSPEFLHSCLEMFSVPSRTPETNNRLFMRKNLNIVDPLKENNNLGRSVSKGNLYRIRSAFAYGARKLGQILLSPKTTMSNELNKFFKNTLERHGDEERPDLQGNRNDAEDMIVSGINPQKVGALSIISDNGRLNEFNSLIALKENGQKQEIYLEPGSHDQEHLVRYYALPCNHARKESWRDCDDFLNSSSIEDSVISHATSERSYSRDNPDTYENSSCTDDANSTNLTKIKHAPHLFFHQENDIKIISGRTAVQSGSYSEVPLDVVDARANGYSLAPDVFDLADLLGECDRHIKNLKHARWCHGYFLNGRVSMGRPLFFPSLFNRQQWDAVSQHHLFGNGLIQTSPFPYALNYYQVNPQLLSSTYNTEDMPKPRGTGMYLNNMNQRMYEDVPKPNGGRRPSPAELGPRTSMNGQLTTPPETCSIDLLGQEPAQSVHQAHVKHAPSDSSHLSDVFLKVFPQVKRTTSPLEGQAELGAFGSVPLSTSTAEPVRSNLNKPSGSTVSSPAKQDLEFRNHGSSLVKQHFEFQNQGSPAKQDFEFRNHGRLSESYHLKDEQEFPPLSSKGHQNPNRTNIKSEAV